MNNLKFIFREKNKRNSLAVTLTELEVPLQNVPLVDILFSLFAFKCVSL